MDTDHYYSQYGEDRILGRLFQNVHKGTCVEVGAYDGLLFSNTLYFERLGWTCILVEPDPNLCECVRINRRGLVFQCAASKADGGAIFHQAQGADVLSTIENDPKHFERIGREGGIITEIQVKTRTLDSILTEAGSGPIDFITVDVEGHEIAVLEGFHLERWRPRLLIIEDNSGLLDDRVRDYMRLRGYIRFYRTGDNDWYGREDDTKLTGLETLLGSEIFADKETILSLRRPSSPEHLVKKWLYRREASHCP